MAKRKHRKHTKSPILGSLKVTCDSMCSGELTKVSFQERIFGFSRAFKVTSLERLSDLSQAFPVTILGSHKVTLNVYKSAPSFFRFGSLQLPSRTLDVFEAFIRILFKNRSPCFMIDPPMLHRNHSSPRLPGSERRPCTEGVACVPLGRFREG